VPGPGQGWPIDRAVEQRHVYLRFQLLDAIGHRRLRSVQLFRRLREAALIDDGEEYLNLIERQGIHVPISGSRESEREDFAIPPGLNRGAL
jgi:hypothetical protein